MGRKYAFFVGVMVLAGLGLPTAPSLSEVQQPPDYSKIFDKTEVMIPTRDGVKLHTEIYVPKDISEPLPILFARTPYGISAPDKGVSGSSTATPI